MNEKEYIKYAYKLITWSINDLETNGRDKVILTLDMIKDIIDWPKSESDKNLIEFEHLFTKRLGALLNTITRGIDGVALIGTMPVYTYLMNDVYKNDLYMEVNQNILDAEKIEFKVFDFNK